MKPYQPRTLALSLEPRQNIAPPLSAAPLDLPFNLSGVSTDAHRSDGDFDGKGQSIAAELLPPELVLHGIRFKLGPTVPGEKNVLIPRGQSLRIPKGSYDRLYVLAAAVGEDVKTTFTLSGRPHPRRVPITIREWQGPIGQWDSRLKEPRLLHEVVIPTVTARQSWTLDAIQEDMAVQFDRTTGAVSGVDRIRRGFVKRDEIAWVGTHRHSPNGNQPYIPTFVFVYALDLPAGASAVQLPSDEHVRIMAITAVSEPPRVSPAGPLYAADLPDAQPTPSTRLGRRRPTQ